MPSWVSFISPSLTSTFSFFLSFSSIYSNSTRSCSWSPSSVVLRVYFFFLLGFPPPLRNRIIIIITLFLISDCLLSSLPLSHTLSPVESSNILFLFLPSVYFAVLAKAYPHIPVSPILHIHFPTTQHITLAERESNSLPITVYFDPGISCGRDFSTDLPSYPFTFSSFLISTSSLFPFFFFFLSLTRLSCSSFCHITRPIAASCLLSTPAASLSFCSFQPALPMRDRPVN